MTISLARWHLLGLSSNAASHVNIGFGCLASLTHENLRLRLLRLSERLETNKPEPSGARCAFVSTEHQSRPDYLCSFGCTQTYSASSRCAANLFMRTGSE